MKRLLLATGTGLLAVLGIVAGAVPATAADALATAKAPADLVTVKGHVRAPNGSALAGITVKVRGKAPFASQYVAARTRTSRTGRYEVKVPRTTGQYAGYEVYAWDPGAPNRVQTDGTWAPLYRKVHTDAAPVVVDVRMARGAGLSGRLTDAADRPVRAGLAVYARLRSTALPLSRRTGVAFTDAAGRYRFTNLPAGPTTLCFEAITSTTYDRCYTGASGGSLIQTDAKRLELAAGRTRTGVDFTYPRVEGGIAGRVLLDGEPIDSDEHFAYVDLLDADGTVLDTRTTYSTFGFKELDAGTYFLRIHGGGDLGDELGSEYYRNAETFAAATPITVRRGKAVAGLVLDLTSD